MQDREELDRARCRAARDLGNAIEAVLSAATEAAAAHPELGVLCDVVAAYQAAAARQRALYE